MNIFKQNVRLVFSLGILSLFTFLSSCVQDEVMLDEPQGLFSNENDVETVQFREGYLIPNSVLDQGAEFTTQYMTEASDEVLELLARDFLVARYLQDIDKISDVGDAQEGEFHFSRLDYSIYLSNLEIGVLNAELERFRFAAYSASLRGCPHTRWEPCCWQDHWGNWHGCWVSTGGNC